MLTTKAIGAGEHDVFWNGEKVPYRIVNGSIGVSGRGRNMYGIIRAGTKPAWIGSLAACKKTLAFWLQKK